MESKEVLYRILPLGFLIATVGFVSVNNQVQVSTKYYTSQPEAVMPQPSVIPGRGFSTKLK